MWIESLSDFSFSPNGRDDIVTTCCHAMTLACRAFQQCPKFAFIDTSFRGGVTKLALCCLNLINYHILKILFFAYGGQTWRDEARLWNLNKQHSSVRYYKTLSPNRLFHFLYFKNHRFFSYQMMNSWCYKNNAMVKKIK